MRASRGTGDGPTAQRWPLKYLATLVAGSTPSTQEDRFWASTSDNGIPWISIGDMTRDLVVRCTSKHVTQEGARANRLHIGPPGTLLFSMYGSLGKVAETAMPACWNQAILGVFPDPRRVDQRFLRYALEALGLSLSEIARSNTQDNVSAELIRNLKLPCPPLEEQRCIAEFLDAEIARLDRLVVLKRKLMSKLPLRVGAAAREALAELPRNGRLGYAVAWFSGGTPPKDAPEHWEGLLPWVSTKDLNRDLLDDAADHITDEAALAYSKVAPAGSVLLATRGMALANRLPLAVLERPMAFNQDLKALVPAPGLLEPAYLRMVLRAFESELLSLVTEAAHGTRRLETAPLKRFRFPLPRVEEQLKLVERVAVVEDRDSHFAAILRRQIQLLNERRNALVTAAVTGQRDPSSHKAPAG